VRTKQILSSVFYCRGHEDQHISTLQALGSQRLQ